MIYIDELTFTVMFYAVMFIVFASACLVVCMKSLYAAYHEMYKRIGLIEIQKQDDQSAYITDDEWFELSKQYGFEWDVKPYQKITHDSAVRLLQYLKNRKSEER